MANPWLKGILVVGGLLLAAPALANDDAGYAGDLGARAIAAGNLRGAEQALLADRAVEARDPAQLINLGHIYARTGRSDLARDMFMAVTRLPSEDLILMDGRTMSSRKAARIALTGLSQ